MLTASGFNILWVEKIDSTNSEARRLMEDTLQSPFVIVAEEQDHGRGQGDHSWHSRPGRNLTFSIGIRYDSSHPFKAEDQQILTMATSLAALDFLAEEKIEAKIKMPNDIYVQTNKICGILIENGLTGPNMSWSIIGIGFNINETDYPEYLPNPVSLKMLTGIEYDKKKCLRNFLRHFSFRFDAIWTEPDVLKKDYLTNIISLKR